MTFTVKLEASFLQVELILRKSGAEIWLISGDSTFILLPNLIGKKNQIKSAAIETMITGKVIVN